MKRVVVLGLALLLAGCVGPKRVTRSAAKVELGAAYYREGNIEGAIETLREAARLDPGAWRPWNALAVAYIAKGQNELAEDAFHQALRRAPGEAEILNNQGTLYLKTGRMDAAVASFKSALDDLDYRNPALIYSNLAYALVLSGKADEGLAYAREATRRAPTMCEAWYHLGLVHEARKDALAALEAYQQVRQQCPKESLGADLRTGCIQVEVGQDDEGIALLQQVLDTVPGTAAADEARGCLTHRAKN
jgi:type IV pilus biogenesis/stability protein PilW